MCSDVSSKTSRVRACPHWQRPSRATIAQRKAYAAADERARVWSGRGTALCKQRTRLRSSGVSSRSARNGGCSCRAENSGISHSWKLSDTAGGPHHRFVKRGFAARASADRKRCSFDRLRLRPGRSTRYTVGGRCGYTGAMLGGRQWRSRPRRLLGARLCGGAWAGAAAATKSHRLGCRSGGSHGRQKAR